MNRRRKVFERVVNPLLIKHLETYNGTFDGPCIASNIPIKYLSYFKEVSAQKNAKKVRYRYRGVSKTMPNGYVYNRPQSFCHMQFADTFSIYDR
jgi:hypothetical protein